MAVNPKLTEIVDCLYRVAAKAVIVQNDNVLLVRDAPGDKWGFPGGGVDYGESIEAALKRELVEELGVNEDSIYVHAGTQLILIGHVKQGLPRCNIHYAVDITAFIKGEHENVDVVESMWLPIKDISSCEFDSAAGRSEDILKLIRTIMA